MAATSLDESPSLLDSKSSSMQLVPFTTETGSLGAITSGNPRAGQRIRAGTQYEVSCCCPDFNESLPHIAILLSSHLDYHVNQEEGCIPCCSEGKTPNTNRAGINWFPSTPMLSEICQSSISREEYHPLSQSHSRQTVPRAACHRANEERTLRCRSSWQV